MYRCDYVDLRSMSLDVKVLFGNLSLVSAPAFSSRSKALQIAGYSPSYRGSNHMDSFYRKEGLKYTIRK